MKLRWIVKKIYYVDFSGCGYGGKGNKRVKYEKTLQSFNAGKWSDVPSYNEDELVDGV